ncbi:MAG: cysteine--tRNA ligase [Alphaproteobacteria bacterium]|nr:cysteine--tRNA ligase [Alphaproteobacteria bacterium]
MIRLFNTRTHQLESFKPQNPNHITMYVCGPTVYDIPHIGNTRPSVVFDVLYRLLRHHYPRVTYVQNITDIDDKIIARAQEQNIPWQTLTKSIEKTYKKILTTMGVEPPTHTPRATDHVESIISIIENLISSNSAYQTEDGVFFHVPTCPNYGALTHKNLDDLLDGVRIENAHGKKNPADFALWKQAKPSEPYWESPWGNGRPGWHIECSAMIHTLLGETIDIHAGGIDLAFPHHENEIAQSTCYTGKEVLAHYFLHNGHVFADGGKMSKSLGNTITLDQLITQHEPAVIRLALLMTHYRQPLNWCEDLLEQSSHIWEKISKYLPEQEQEVALENATPDFINALQSDLNTPLALRCMISALKQKSWRSLLAHCQLLGLPTFSAKENFLGDKSAIERLITQRLQAKQQRDFALSDQIRAQLFAKGITLTDHPDNTCTWSYNGNKQ